MKKRKKYISKNKKPVAFSKINDAVVLNGNHKPIKIIFQNTNK